MPGENKWKHRCTGADEKEGNSMEDQHRYCKGTVVLGYNSTLLQHEESCSVLNSEWEHITASCCDTSPSAAATAVSKDFFYLHWRDSLLNTSLHERDHKRLKIISLARWKKNAFNVLNLKSDCFNLLLPEFSATYFRWQSYDANELTISDIVWSECLGSLVW